MNEEALQEAFRLFASQGYNGDINKFVNLISTNQEALQEAHRLFTSEGYNGDINKFKTLIGVGQQPAQQQPAQQQQTTKIQSLTQQPPAKKKEPTVSSSEGGLSGWLGSSIEGFVEKYQPRVEEDKPEDVSAWKRKVQQGREEQKIKPALPATDYMQGYLKEEGKGVPFIEEKKEPLSFLGRMTQEKIEEESPEFTKIINSVNSDIIDKGVDSAAKELNYYFRDAGFSFAPVKRNGFEDIIVRSPNGEQLMINIGGWSNDDTAEEIKNFIKKNYTRPSDIKKVEKMYLEENKKFINEEKYNEEVSKLNTFAEDFKNSTKTLLSHKAEIDNIEKKIKEYPQNLINTPQYQKLVEDYNQRIDAYNTNYTSLEERAKNLEAQDNALKKSVGEYTKMKSEQGTVGGYLWNKFTTGAGKLTSGFTNFYIDRYWNNMPLPWLLGQEAYEEEMKNVALDLDVDINKVLIADKDFWKLSDYEKRVNVKLRKDLEDFIRDDYKKMVKYGEYRGVELNTTTIKDIREFFLKNFGTSGTTKEYAQRIDKEGNIVIRGLGGLAESAPSMLTPIPGMRMLNMYMLSTDAVREEMENDPDFKDISENEKEMVLAPIGIVGAVLEEIGLRSLLKGTSLIKNITGRVINNIPTGATASQIRNATLQEIKNMGLKGGGVLVGGTLAEAETGALQQMNEYAVKDLYNVMKGKDMFDTPIFMSQDYINKVSDAAATESVGGFTLSIPGAISAAFEKDGFQALDDDTFKIFEELAKDNKIRKFFVIDLKNKINKGEITAKQSQQMLDAYDQASGMIGTVDEEITDIQSRKIAMDLISERKKLEAKKDKTDPALAKPIQDKIDNINKQLTQLTQDAIQKQTTGEVSLQPETEPGKEMEAGGPEAGPQAAPKQGVLSPEEEEKLRNNRRVDLFPEESEFADVIGGSGRNSSLSNYSEVNGVGVASYTNPDNGVVDVIMSGTSDNDYVGYVRVYENGKPTNRWTSKMSNESGNKDNFKTMISEVQSRLPENHEYTESTNISIDGVRVYSNQLNRGYEVLTDANGNPVTNTVTLNAASVQGLQQATTQEEKQSLYDSMAVTTKEQFDALRDKITALMPNVNVTWNQANNTVQLQLPVLVQSKKATTTEQVGTEQKTTQETFEQKKSEIEKITDPEQRKVAEIEFIMSNLMSGVGEASANKIREYADRIISGKETRDQVIQGLPKSFVDGIDQLLAAQQAPATTPTATEVTPVEQQFTEQDRARKAELEEAMRKADKRRKNITVGETTMPKAEAKAELDALNQKEQATQQPVTPAVEAAPTATAPVETMTAEQEADLLEELMTGKKKETAPTAEVKAEPTSKEAIAKRLRGKKNKGLMSSIDFGISQALYNGALEFMASQVEKGTKLGNAIENTIKWIDEKMQGKSWDKDGFTKYANTTFEEVATKKKAKAILDVYPKGSVVGIADLASESGDTIISNVLSKMKDVFNKVKISGRRPTEGAAFYNYNTKEIDVNKNSPHWDEVEGDQIASALSHEFAHHLIDGHSEKEAIETDLQEIKDDLIANKPELTESQKKAYEFMTSKNNSPQEILTYAVSDPDIRPILTKYKDKLNNISNKLFGEDVISGIFEEQKSKTNEIQPQRTRDGRGRTESRAIAPLEGAPSVQGFVGPDPQLTAVAEEYAKENGIPYKRQAEYVKVDEDRAKRIAEAYEEMKHDPQNPKVKEAYENLIKQTIAQYEALVKAGYKFWFIDTNIPSNLEYAQSPFNAMRDVRSNKQMGVFPTTDGFGSSDVDVSDNPMMAETKFKWPVGGMDGELKPVLANDLFRAVHDAFGHGLEGAGFRARGEENAWQAHIRLFTGSAVGAITSETRGQNSWLNFGPHGEKNRAANTDETIFADQKTGLMPEWTWKEGVAADMEITAKPFATSLADAVRKNLTIKTGGLQSNILGVPIAIWNAGVKTVAKSIEVGMSISDAIKRGINYIKEKHGKKFNEASVEKKMLIGLYSGAIQTAREAGITNEGLKTYLSRKGATEEQIEALLKYKERSEKKPISKEKIIGKPKPKMVTITVNDMTELKKRIKIEAKAAKEGKKQVTDAVKEIVRLFNQSKVITALTRADLKKIINLMDKVYDDASLQKAVGEMFDIILKSNPDLIEVSKTKLIEDFKRKVKAGIREGKKDLNTKRKELAAAIKKLADKGSITLRQAKALINKVNSVNLDNPVMVERLLDYAEKVFNDAEYAEKIERINSLLGKAKENVKTKIGVSEGLTALMNKLFSINPNIIPAEIFEAYSEIVEMMGKRQAVLTLKEANELTKDVEKVLDVITDELSNLDELIDIFDNYENKVLDENGKIDFSATLDKMLEDGTITPNDVKLYKKYKNKVLPREAKEKKTEQQLAEEKKELIDAIRQTKVDESNLNMREERDAARNLISAMTPENLNGLTNAELANLLKVLDNINNGFFPHYAVKMTQKLNATNRKETLGGAIKTAGRLPLTKLIANIKSLFPGAKSANMIMVIESPKYVIDQVFGFFKKSPIYDSVFKPVVELFATYKTDAKAISEKLEKAYNKVAKSHWSNPAKVKMSQFKMMTYALQLEYQSNKDKGEKFYSAAEYIKETIKHTLGDQSTMSNRDVQLLEKILNTYGVKDADGNFIDINIDKLYDSFNNAEKQAIKTIQEVNASIRDKAMFTAAAINGNKIMPIDNYVHHNVLPTGTNTANLRDPIGELNKKMNPSTRAAVLKERTPGAKPLNFNIFDATQKSANEVLMDFHLTEGVRTSKMVLSNLRKELEERGDKKQLSIFNAIEKSFETALENTLTNTFNDSTFVDNVVSFITKQAYRVLLAGVSRWTAELASNLAYVLKVDPVAYMDGITKYRKYVMSEKGPAILRNIKSGVQDRVYEDSILSGRMIDGSIMNEAIGLSGTTSNYMVVNAMQTIYNNTLKKGQNFVASTADTLISTPDKGTLRPFYIGIFAKEFKKITGQNIDLDKIAANDEAYLKKFKEAIDKSKDFADYHIKLAGGTKNPFASREKSMTVKNASALAQGYKSFNNFMNSFIIGEYIAARTGIYAMMGNGKLTRKQGAAVLAGVVARTTLYTILIKELAAGVAWLFLGDDDEEDEEKVEKSLIEKSGQAFAGSMTSLILGRDFGNLTRNMINYGVEKVNENYVQKMIDGKYTKEDVIAFNSLIPSSLGSRPQFSDLLINMSGAGQPFLRSAKTLYETYFADEPKGEATIKKRQNYWRYTLPLEIAGHLGFVPLYKDVKSITNKALQREVDKIKGEESGGGIIKRKKFEDYDSAEEFEMEDPEGYAKYEEIQKRHRTERRADKKEFLNGYDSETLFKESDEEGYLEAIKDGSIYEYKKRERKREEEKNQDKPFFGYSEEKFKKLYPDKWAELYGPGTDYYESQRTPEALERKREERRREAEFEAEEKKAEAERLREAAQNRSGY